MDDESGEWRVDERGENPRFVAAVRFVTALGAVYVAVGVAGFFVLLKIRNAKEQAGEEVPHWASNAWAALIVVAAGVLLSAAGLYELFVLRRAAR